MSGNPETHAVTALVVPPLQATDLPEFMNTMVRFAPRPSEQRGAPASVSDLIATIHKLGADGHFDQCRILSAFLHHPDSTVADAAEQSLWTIWMQAGGARGNEFLAEIVSLVAQSEWADALAVIEVAIGAEPDFAELHHQRGIVLSMLEDFASASEAYAEAFRLNPYHFAAASGLGHVCVELGRWRPAEQAYAHAVRINPRMAEIAEACSQLGQALGIEA